MLDDGEFMLALGGLGLDQSVRSTIWSVAVAPMLDLSILTFPAI